MDTIASRLPVTLGSAAGLVVAGLGYLTQASPVTCLTRAAAAYAVFAAFGIVLRYLFTLAAEQVEPLRGGQRSELGIESVEPGTTVEDLLAQS